MDVQGCKVFEKGLKIAAEHIRWSQVAWHQENILLMEFKPDFFQGLTSNSHVHSNNSIHDLKKNNKCSMRNYSCEILESSQEILEIKNQEILMSHDSY